MNLITDQKEKLENTIFTIKWLKFLDTMLNHKKLKLTHSFLDLGRFFSAVIKPIQYTEAGTKQVSWRS